MKAPTHQTHNHTAEFRNTRQPLHRSGCQRAGKILLLLVVSLVGLAYADTTYGAAESSKVANAAAGEQMTQSEQEVRNARGLMIAEAGQAAYTGEFFRVGGRKVQLLRSLEKIAVRYPPSESLSVMNQLHSLTQPQGGFLIESDVSEQGITVLQTPRFASPDELDESIRELEQTPGIVRAVPVYIHEESGLELVPTDELIVKLAAGADSGVLQALNDALGAVMVRPLWGTTDQFILAIPDCTAEELLSTCEIYWQDPAIEWANPNFLAQLVKCDVRPNDPLYGSQWHLSKIQAPQAWDATSGSGQIVIAIIDDGMDLMHEDLNPNLWNNSLEIANNGLDDDNNGYVDDRNGWNFFDHDPNPNPADSDDNHGTSCAGVAAAKGNNSLGVAGCAFDCRLMPLKLLKGRQPVAIESTAEAIYYAAGRTKNGGSWRGADVISISFTGSEFNPINNALAFAAGQGRGGKGCPIFCATGNDAAGWKKFTLRGFPAGTYTFKWEYTKNATVTNGSDTVWLDSVAFPGGSWETFETIGDIVTRLPLGWTTGGNAHWEPHVGHAMTGWDGPNSYGVRAGQINHNESTYIQVTKTVSAGELTFWCWPSCEANYDGLRLYVNGIPQWGGQIIASGEPEIHTAIGYPASNRNTIAVGASTDFDYRADYSQYGAELDFVAPSNGGAQEITTTDRTGGAGYNKDGDYTSTFGGTSSATPLAAGVAALILSKNPDLTAQQVRETMRNTCDQIGSVPYDINGWNQYYGYGRINARAALGVEGREKEAVTLIASDGRAGDQFGRSVSVSGDYAVIGAKDSAYLFKREGASWIEQNKLSPSQRRYYHDMGRGVSTSGNYAAVASLDAVHTYDRSSTGWSETTKLVAYPDESGDGFASTLSMTRDYIIVGAPHRTVMGYRDRGSAFIFRRSGSGWTQHQELTSWDYETNWNFGESVSISGDYAIVGIPQTNASYYRDFDRAYIFERHGQSWERVAKLISPQSGTRFGRSVCISGNYAAVRGASSVYIYERDASGWQMKDQLTASDFGESISLSTDYLIVGASDSAYVFKRTASKWTQKTRLTPPAGQIGVGFGNSVSLNGDYAVVGAPYDDSKGSDSGAAYVFRLSQISD